LSQDAIRPPHTSEGPPHNVTTRGNTRLVTPAGLAAVAARTSCQATVCGMYLRVTRGAFDPSQREAVVAVSKELAKEATIRPGVRSCHIGLSSAGEFIAFTEGDTEESVTLSRESLGDLLAKMAAVLQLQSPEMYELVGS
jgi:hypothetical protein